VSILLLVLALLQQPAPAGPKPRNIDKGANSGITVVREVTIRDAAKWADLWKTHAPDKPRPAIDFSKEMVVGVFLGGRMTGGFSVEILSAKNESGVFVVHYRETRPPSDKLTAQVITTPYHLAAVPAFAGIVRFDKAVAQQ
jgi:hypothetical protein